MSDVSYAPFLPAIQPPDIIIDLFAGGGGTSTGIEQAAGRSPDIAVNHDREALDLHAANHPTTLHLCDDIRQIDVVALLSRPEFAGRRVGLLWASPDCKDHSKAKGGVPKDKNIRGLAWEVLRWVAAIRRATGKPPRTVALENVEEFADWGPLHRYGKKAGRVMKHRRKETFQLWKENLQSLGGVLEERELIAAEYGAPTTRKRLYVVCQFDGDPIIWPAATHAPRQKVKRQPELFGGSPLKPYRAAAEIIDWSRPTPSIFGRRKSLAPKTERRIARGIDRFVIRAERPFIIPVTHSTGGDRAYDPGQPLRTLTGAKGGDFQLVSPSIHPVTHQGDARVHGPTEPLTTITGAHRGELALSAAHLMRTDMQSAADRNGIHSPDEPLRTVTSGGGFGVSQVLLAGASVGVGGRAGQSPPRSLGDPVNTVTAKGDRAIAAAMLVPRYGERDGHDPRVLSVEGPAPTVVPDGNGGSLAVAYLGRQFGTTTGQSVEEPHPTIMSDGAGGKSQAIAAHITKFHHESAGSAIDAPLPTVTANSYIKRPGGAAPLGVASAFVDKYYATGVPQEADRPLDAVTSRGRFGLNSAFLEQANTGMVGHAATEPLSTIVGGGSSNWGTTQRLVGADLEPWSAALDEIGAPAGSKRREVLAFLWTHFGAPTAEEWADPTATLQGRLRFGLVILDGVAWQIVDVGMRMLTPRELYSAQGFPPSYVIEITLANGKPLTKTAQTRMAGNSVSPPVAEAIIATNCPWLREQSRIAA